VVLFVSLLLVFFLSTLLVKMPFDTKDCKVFVVNTLAKCEIVLQMSRIVGNCLMVMTFLHETAKRDRCENLKVIVFISIRSIFLAVKEE